MLLSVDFKYNVQCLCTANLLESGEVTAGILVGCRDRRRMRSKNAATNLLRLDMEMDEERKARLEMMVATKRLRLAIEKMTKEKQDWRIW